MIIFRLAFIYPIRILLARLEFSVASWILRPNLFLLLALVRVGYSPAFVVLIKTNNIPRLALVYIVIGNLLEVVITRMFYMPLVPSVTVQRTVSILFILELLVPLMCKLALVLVCDYYSISGNDPIYFGGGIGVGSVDVIYGIYRIMIYPPKGQVRGSRRIVSNKKKDTLVYLFKSIIYLL